MTNKSAKPIAVLTGAGGGIGRATASVLAKSGFDLIVTDIDSDSLRLAREVADSFGAQVAEVVGDIGSQPFRDELVSICDRTFGRVDALINNAGVIAGTPLDETTESQWDRLIGINAKSPFFLIKAFHPYLRESKGAVVNVSSTAGLIGFPSMPAYVASKTACVGLTRALAVDFAPEGIRVNAVCPATIDTPMPRAYLAGVPKEKIVEAETAFFARNLIKRFGTPEEVAEAILFLASPRSSFFTGVALPVDGGVTAW